MQKYKRVVVFDFDETLGQFSQPYKFWQTLKKFLRDNILNTKYLYRFFDIFPQYFRTNLFKILTNIKIKKINGYCDSVMIYTNNGAQSFWVDTIKDYIHKKLNYKLFDQVIRAYKINGKKIELCRTSYSKSHKDFLSCSKLPYDTQICFIDDQVHPQMDNNNVKYIVIQPYIYNLNYTKLSKIYFNYNKKLFSKHKKTKQQFIQFINENLNHNDNDDNHENYTNISNVQQNIDLLISKKINNDIMKFLGKNNYTRKRKFQTSTRTPTRTPTRPRTRTRTRTRIQIATQTPNILGPEY
tara:strand:+ start:1842 stop:2732 length:891 start_codon:yes stop_codon:yes gene_type:complete